MKLRHPLILASTMLPSLALAAAAVLPTPDRIAYNATPSAAIGFYALVPVARPVVGDQLLVQLPAPAAALADARHYLPRGVPVLKRVAAIAPARICRHGAIVTIDAVVVARALARDRAGRPLPVWRGCHKLRSHELFLLSGAAPDAFDGRYFGPTNRRSVVAKARPLWVW